MQVMPQPITSRCIVSPGFSMNFGEDLKKKTFVVGDGLMPIGVLSGVA